MCHYKKLVALQCYNANTINLVLTRFNNSSVILVGNTVICLQAIYILVLNFVIKTFRMNIKTLSLLLTALFFYSACTKAQQLAPSENKILIVYLSRTANTKFLADIIHQTVGGELVALELQHPYSEDYRENVEQVAKENEEGFLPVLKTKIANIEKYDTVFIGFPTWGYAAATAYKVVFKAT